MNAPLDLKRSGWIWQVTILSLVLGMLLAAALKTQQTLKRSSGIPTTRVSGLAQLVLDEKDRNSLLRKEITDLRAKVDEYERALGEGTTQTELLRDELQKAKFLAGLTPAKGDGIEVTLRDSTLEPPADYPADLVMDDYIIHDQDLLLFVNELLANGAEAVAVNDQRVISKTAIRCVGATIRVNDVPVGPVYTITAIGPPDVLESALKIRHGVIDQFRYDKRLAKNMIQVKKKTNLGLPAYSGSTLFKYTAVVDPERKPK